MRFRNILSCFRGVVCDWKLHFHGTYQTKISQVCEKCIGILWKKMRLDKMRYVNFVVPHCFSPVSQRKNIFDFLFDFLDKCVYF